MGDLSPHFSAWEFACRDGSTHSIDVELLQRLEGLRAELGDHPLRIVSGYRSVAYNRSIGGAVHSQHLYGRAVDLVAGVCTIAQAQVAGFRGIGHCNGWAVHLDVRPGVHITFLDC